MATNLDIKMLTGFSQEVQSYLPQIREGIEHFCTDTTQREALEEAMRYIHTIKGASGMLGISVLSQVASSIEETLEEVLNGQFRMNAERGTWLCQATDQIEQYMAGLLSGDAHEQEFMTEVEQLLRRFKDLSGSSEDEAAGEEMAAPPETLAMAHGAESPTADEEPDVPAESVDANLTLVDTTLADLPVASSDDTGWAGDFTLDLLADTLDEVDEAAEEEMAAPPETLAMAQETESLPVHEEAELPAESVDANLTLVDTTLADLTAVPSDDTGWAGDFTPDLLADTLDEVDEAAATPNVSDHDDSNAAFAGGDPTRQPEPLPETVGDAETPIDPSGPLDTLIATIDNDVRQVYGHGPSSTAEQNPEDNESTSQRYLIFTLAGSWYAVPTTCIVEIGRIPSITPVPNVPAWVRGVINLRGEILSVIDFRTFLGIEEGRQEESGRMLVVKTVGDAMTTSLIVDQVKGMVRLSTAHMDTPATPNEDKVASYLSGIQEYEAQVLAVFDLERFLQSPEICQFD